MQFRSFVYEPDPLVRSFLRSLLRKRGHDVLAFATGIPCPMCCDGPCADFVLVDLGLNQHAGVGFVRAQAAVGCRAAHKALVGSEWTAETCAAAAGLGCPVFSKPYIGPALGAWLDELEPTIPPDRVLRDGYRRAQRAE